MFALALALVPSASALSCAPGDPLCDAVAAAVDAANAAYGQGAPGPLESGAPRADLRPAHQLQRFRDLDAALVASGCSVEGWLGGRYRAQPLDGGWDGGAFTGQRSGGHAFHGWMQGGETVGHNFARFHEAKQLVAERGDGGFVAGTWARVAGQNGVYLAVHGSCVGDPSDALSGWFAGGVGEWGWVPPSATTVQNHDGVCPTAAGCAPGVLPGAATEMMECFRTGLTAPVTVYSVDYDIGDDPGAPQGLRLQLRSWDGVGAPGPVVHFARLAPVLRGPGPRTWVSAHGVDVPTADFCVGVRGESPTDAFRVARSGALADEGLSWLSAPRCGLPLQTTTDLGLPGPWCVSARVE